MKIKEVRDFVQEISNYGFFKKKISEFEGIENFETVKEDLEVYKGLTVTSGLRGFKGGTTYDIFQYLSANKPENKYVLCTTAISHFDEFDEEAILFIIDRNEEYTLDDVALAIRDFLKK